MDAYPRSVGTIRYHVLTSAACMLVFWSAMFESVAHNLHRQLRTDLICKRPDPLF